MTAITLNIAFAVVGLSRMRGGSARTMAATEPVTPLREAVPMLSDFASSRVASVAWFRTHRPLPPG